MPFKHGYYVVVPRRRFLALCLHACTAIFGPDDHPLSYTRELFICHVILDYIADLSHETSFSRRDHLTIAAGAKIMLYILETRRPVGLYDRALAAYLARYPAYL